MTAELQSLADALATRVGRPLVLEDRRQRMIVYSRHSEPMDDVRRDSILQRETTPEVIEWFCGLGLREATGPVRFRACERLGMLPRVCIPLRHQGALLGFVWFIDADESMTDAEIDIAAAAGRDFALALHLDNRSRDLLRQRETEAVRDLLLGEPADRTRAADDLLEGGHFVPSASVVAMVGLPVRTPGDADGGLRPALECGLTGVRHLLGAHETMHLVRTDHGALIVAGEPRCGFDVEACARELRDALRAAVGRQAGTSTVVVGVGAAVTALEQVTTSYQQARLAARAAAHLPAVGTITRWEQLGVYRVLLQLSDEDLQRTPLHQGLARLLDDPAAAPLVETLETYLDLAGNAQRTAERLFLHRTTLYYRLARIGRLTGADLADGNDRLALHLGLKLARLSGRYHPVAAAPAS